jgi:hypothetical protein
MISRGVPPNEVQPWRSSAAATSWHEMEVEKMPRSSHLTLKPVTRQREAKGERDRDLVRVGLRPGARSVGDPETGRRAGAGRQGADHQGVVVNQHPGGEGDAGTGQDRRGERGQRSLGRGKRR